MPLFSIIIPSYNVAEKIEATLAAVYAQDPGLYELVVVDGGSRDGTVDILRRQNGRLRWISEPDRGVYDAMNKGIAMAAGRYLYFLGAGDLLAPGVLEAIAPCIPEHDRALVYGSVRVPGDETKYYGKVGRYWLCLGYNICHQAVFYGREIFALIGAYDLRYRARADYALNIAAFSDERIEKRYLDLVIAEYERGGLSDGAEDEEFARDLPALVCRGLGLPQAFSVALPFVLRLRFNPAFRTLGQHLFQFYRRIG